MTSPAVSCVTSTPTLATMNYKLLGLAILKIAMRDARRGDLTARNWLLFAPLARLLFDVLDVDAERVRRVVLGMG